MKTLFYDTYALFEIAKGNQNFKEYTSNVGMITTQFQLMELYYGLLRQYGKEKAEMYYDIFQEYCVSVEDQCIKKAMALKLAEKEKRLSYVDCIGYVMALQRNIPFLTGDKQFENMPTVEFVK